RNAHRECRAHGCCARSGDARHRSRRPAGRSGGAVPREARPDRQAGASGRAGRRYPRQSAGQRRDSDPSGLGPGVGATWDVGAKRRKPCHAWRCVARLRRVANRRSTPRLPARTNRLSSSLAVSCCLVLAYRMRCLALNASFEPLTMVPVRRALRLVIDGKAEVVEAEGTPVHSERMAVPRPAVIRLVRFVHVPRRFRRQVTNTFLFARDNYRCQFCGRSQQELRQRECLTRDHLVPLSRGGTNAWTNVLTACSSCNTRKGNLLPEEVGMHPLRSPHEPHFVHLSWAVRRLTRTQAKYIRLFYGADVLATLEAL